MGARYYDPIVGRFINADSVLGANSDLTAYNLYAYCGNNPVCRYDSNGMLWHEIISGMLHMGNEWALSVGIDTAAIGAFFLDMEYNEKENFYYVKDNCWQRYFGYTDMYDKLFALGTSMDKAKYEFTYEGTDYVIWLWKGDYINMGAGAEMAIYYKGVGNYWIADPNIAKPMSLVLYYGKECIVDYKADYVRTWWITGFNPEYQNVNVSELKAYFYIIMGNMFESFWSVTENREACATLQFIDVRLFL